MSFSRRAAAILAILGASAAPAAAYEFSIHSRIIAQAYDLRSIRLTGPDLWLGRRRYTQTLSLDLIDLGDLAAKRHKEKKHFGPTITFSSYLRVDHDFGDWTQGRVMSGSHSMDATDAVPELRSSSLDLDLLYAYLDVHGLADGAIDLRLGRQLRVDALDWFAMDGLTARVETPVHVAVEAFGGLRVRDASPLGSYQVELDGTSGADCREYVEQANNPGIGHGAWLLIDRTQALIDHPRADDTGYCPQRNQLMPTYGAALETTKLHSIYARVMYRRSESKTAMALYDPGCQEARCLNDQGLYPNEWSQAPRWGVDEERVAATVRGAFDWSDGKGQASPYVAARYSLLHALVDEAEAGVRVRWRDWAIEPEVARFVPTFDGDSIFNVFGALPSTEARLSGSWLPHDGWLRITGSVWLRQFQHDDEGRTIKAPSTSDTAAGFTAAADARVNDRWTARVDAFSDNGFGGLRSGGAAALRWAKNRVSAIGRGSVIFVATDSTQPNIRTLTSALQLGGGWQLADGVAVHGVLETSFDNYVKPDVRALAVVDLAFAPEM